MRVLWVACGAHALHDGLTDTLYLLLPMWQAQFALSYAAIGILRALYTGAMAGFQVPATLTYGSVRSILDNKLDRQAAQRAPVNGVPILHPNIRGPRYYH
jgi:hypothetical protein